MIHSLNKTPTILILILLLFCTGLAKAGTITCGDQIWTTDGTNDHEELQAALDFASSGDTITIREGDYYISQQINAVNKNLNIIGEGEVTFDLHSGSAPGLSFAGSKIKTTALSPSASKGSSQVILSDGSQVHQNDLIRIWNSDKWCPDNYPDQTIGELYVVQSVSGNTVTLNEPLLRDYAAQDTQIEISRPAKVNVKNIRFINQDGSGVYEGLTLSRCIDSSVTDCYFEDNGQRGIGLFTCFNVDVKNNEIYNCIKTGVGYGVSIADACAYITVENNHIENCRHCVMSGTSDYKALNRNILITGNTLIGGNVPGSQVVDSHPMTIDYTVTNNKIYPKPGYVAFHDGTQHSIFSENEIYGGKAAVAKRGTLNGVTKTVSDNEIEGGRVYLGTAKGGSGDTLIIERNTITNGEYGVGLSSDTYEKIVIRENTFEELSEPAVKVSCVNDCEFEISGNTFERIETAISIEANSYDVVAIIRDNDFDDVTKKTSLDGIESSSSGSIDPDSLEYFEFNGHDAHREQDNTREPDITSSGDTISISSTGSSSEQDKINEAIDKVSENGGGTVYLERGVYIVDGTVKLKSNVNLKGDPDAIIRVSPKTSQFFVGNVGILSSLGPIDNIIIEGFQIDGNCDELPRSFANSNPKYSHDAERAILIRAYTNKFGSNVIIRNMQIYDCFSDGIHLAYINNALVYDNFISNCQHEGVFFICVTSGELYRNKVAGICSDCLRLDNCVDNRVYDNILFSYDGNNTNGQGKFGENGLQVGDSGVSKGYDARNKPLHTKNIEIFNNTFANNGLRAIWLDAAGLKQSNNVYVHDNKFIGAAELETMGIPVEGGRVENVSYENMPSVEQSRDVFDSIFSILGTTFYDVAGESYSIVLPENATEIPTESTWTIEQHDNSALVYGPTDGLVSVKCEYAGQEGIHVLMIGERTGWQMTYNSVSVWEGDISRIGDSFYLDGRVDPEKLKITCYTPKGSFEPQIDLIEVENSTGIFNYYILFYLIILGILLSVPLCVLYIIFVWR